MRPSAGIIGPAPPGPAHPRADVWPAEQRLASPYFESLAPEYEVYGELPGPSQKAYICTGWVMYSLFSDI